MKRALVALTALTLLAGCTTAPARTDPATRTTGVQLVSFASCADALAGLRAAARASVGPWGLAHPLADVVSAEGAPGAAARAGADQAPPRHSATNNHEATADEPDLVKTDGRRIVTLTDDVLRVIDPARRTLVGRLDLGLSDVVGGWPRGRLLLHGDRAVVLTHEPAGLPVDRPADARVGIPGRADGGTAVLLIDLTGQPRLLDRYRIGAELVDARQTGGAVRVVVRSHPRVSFPPQADDASDAARTAANRAVIDRTGVDAWLPRYEWTDDGGERRTGRLPCERVSRPMGDPGASLLSLLSFDLNADRLGDGDPVGVAAAGDIVYGTATSLYTAGNGGGGLVGSRARNQTTVIHRFDLTSPGRPRYVASGSVPGHLLNQYALSEWDGHLRVATTTGVESGTQSESNSAVYVLRTDGLRRVGEVTGLGRGERIYSVRYLGGTAHVVTFRQTDPLYTLDLRRPDSPRVTGELKITGYSGYLHPVSEGRLLGVGQEADEQGVTRGLLVSLFDVDDPTRPTRLARYHLPGLRSPADHDAHAFLYWPERGLVVLPLHGREWVGQGAVVLRTDGSTLTEAARITHPVASPAGIHRSLVVGDTLWTVSDAGLQATDLATLAARAWIPAA